MDVENDNLSMGTNILGVLVFAVMQAVTPLPTIEVKAPADVAAVRGLDDSLSALSEKVTACVAAGQPAEKCRCSYPTELKSLRSKHDELLKQHPEWKDQLISYRFVNNEGRNISGTLVLQNLRRQLETLKCG
jgi:molybdopterin converting factor small subunit